MWIRVVADVWCGVVLLVCRLKGYPFTRVLKHQNSQHMHRGAALSLHTCGRCNCAGQLCRAPNLVTTWVVSCCHLLHVAAGTTQALVTSVFHTHQPSGGLLMFGTCSATREGRGGAHRMFALAYPTWAGGQMHSV